MLKKSVIGALSALRGSEVLEGIFRSPRSILVANGHTKCGWYLLASSLAAALPAEWRVLARRGWAGENRGFLSILRRVFLLSKNRPNNVSRGQRSFSVGC